MLRSRLLASLAMLTFGCAAVLGGVAACSGGSSASPSDAGTDAPVADAPAVVLPDAADGDSPLDAAPPFPYTPSNVPLPPLAGLGAITISSQCTLSTDRTGASDPWSGCLTTTGSSPKYTFTSVTQSDGSNVAVLAVGSLTVSQGAQLTVTGAVPLVVIAATTISIQGTVLAQGELGGTNGGGFAGTSSGQGGGPGGGGAGQNNYVGGGGGGYCGHGGAGASASDGGAPPAGGKAYGTATITPLLGGSAGGSPGTGGGRGGGAIQMSAGASLTIGAGGVVSVPGNGADDNGGAGGSGGAILLEAPAIDVQGVLAANGGAADEFNGGGSAPGGQPSATPAAHAGNPQAGVGSGGATINGGDGSSVSPNSTGGGGGAAGRIRLNTTAGAATIGAGAVVSPATSTACVSQGALAK